MKPTLGRIVHYRVPAHVADQINNRRNDAMQKRDWHREHRTGAQVHVGNGVSEGDVFPLIITRLWGSDEGAAFNGQLLLDGSDNFWVTSTSLGDGLGKCFWPPRE